MKDVSGGNAIFKAPMFHECIINQCHVVTSEGNERRSMMQLHIQRLDGVMLQRPFNDGPYYKCERRGCHYREHPVGLHELNSRWVRDGGKNEPKKQVGDELTPEEMEVWV
ncbi:MAG: hypothetical protein GY906_18165 [bacterium]|nr:hypothetical protein [bacterium]